MYPSKFTHRDSRNWPLSSHGIDDFSYHSTYVNALPAAEVDNSGRITRQSFYEDEEYSKPAHEKNLILPSIAVVLPLVLLSATLLGLVFGYKVEQQLDDLSTDPPEQYGNGTSVILVDFSASKFLKSMLS
jgi:ABC-type multidrug transport system permease subunit